ncbi:MAG TPA: PadR family transcriptional regulator, partial [Kineosporiaceae bacterium]|nr:PadR family transcriptional regulator [Kineosporiaceae bacterium]
AFGQVYSTLSRLQRDSLVQVAHTESGDGPDRVVYELTEQGRQRVIEWLSDPVDPAGAHAEELIRKTLAAYRLNADPDGLMARQRTLHLRRIRALEPAGPAGRAGTGATELAPRLLEDHIRLHLDADLRWLEIAADRIRRQPAQHPGLPSQPSKPIQEIGPGELAEPVEADELVEPGKPTEPIGPSELSRPTEPIEATEPRAGGTPA